MAYNFNIIKNDTGLLSIVSDFSDPIELTFSGDEKIVTIESISDLISLDTFMSSITGISNNTNLKLYFALSNTNNPDNYTDWIEFENGNTKPCFPSLSTFYDYNLRIKFSRVGTNENGTITIDNIIWDGQWNINATNTPVIKLTPTNSPIIFRVENVYKVFSLTGYELVAKNVNLGLNIEYRISQDNKRTWTRWTPLTIDNIVSEKITPIRFFNIEYKFEHTGSSGDIEIRDIVFKGEFIDITNNANKIYLFGLREDCASNINTGSNIDGGLSQNTTSGNAIWSAADCNKDQLFNPYQLDEAKNLYQKLVDDASNMFGWSVKYFKTDPDANGTDYTFNEYTLYNIVQTGDVKVLVNGNKLPNGQVRFNQYDLALMDVFEVSITKTEFKSMFGVEKKPTKEDFLYFCEVNRMFQVDSAQPIRGFANAQVYYKVILKKFNQKSSVKAANNTIQDEINDLLKNSTMQDLFSTEIKDDRKATANKEQLKTLSEDTNRSIINATISKALIENSTLIVSKYNYDLSGVSISMPAVLYQNADVYLRAGDNRSIYAWFKLKTYNDTGTYNIITNMNPENNIGYSVSIVDGLLVTTLNDTEYTSDINEYLIENVWYCILVNINQRQRELTHTLYKRNSIRELDAKSINSSKLLKLHNDMQELEPIEFEYLNSEFELKITPSNMYITNIRIMSELIEGDDTNISNILNQQIIKDSQYLILADNANKKINAARYPYN